MAEIELGREGRCFTLRSRLILPRPRTEVFPFFADARNLGAITPPWLKFRILSASPDSMQVGARILYQLRIHGFPLKWESEITVWDPPFRFIDEQRRGPYRTWIHEHSFEERDGGCEMTDNVHYAVAGGRIINSLFVKNDVLRIFRYRSEILQNIFPSRDSTTNPREK